MSALPWTTKVGAVIRCSSSDSMAANWARSLSKPVRRSFVWLAVEPRARTNSSLAGSARISATRAFSVSADSELSLRMVPATKSPDGAWRALASATGPRRMVNISRSLSEVAGAW